MSVEWLSTEDVAKELKVRVERVREWIRRGDLIAFRVGGSDYRIKRVDLDKFIEESRTNPESNENEEK